MSLRLRLLIAAGRLLARRRIARAADPLVLRRIFRPAGQSGWRTPPATLVLPRTLAAGVPALLVANRPGCRPVRRRKVILYLHGGAFVAGAAKSFVPMLARLSRLTRSEIVAPDYRLAPEDPFPAAVEDARHAWDALIASGYRPHDVLLGGDSAGGNLALALLAELLACGVSPAGLFAFSPVTDLGFTGETIKTNASRDAVLPAQRRADLVRLYLAGHSPDDPRASPLRANFPDPPPVFLQYAATEILADDSRRMAARLRAAGGQVTLDEWPDAPHVWVFFDGMAPEARRGLERAAAFINAQFDQAVTGEAGKR